MLGHTLTIEEVSYSIVTYKFLKSISDISSFSVRTDLQRIAEINFRCLFSLTEEGILPIGINKESTDKSLMTPQSPLRKKPNLLP